jgi:hypothetical protein
MSPLNHGTEIILAVSADWFREIARQGMLPATNETGLTDLVVGKFLEQNHEGIWIDLPENMAQLTVPSLFVPSRYIFAIVIGGVAERKNMGFRG